MRLGTIGGVPVRVHPLLILILLAAGLGGYLWPAVILAGLIVTHELAHLVVARAYGLEVSEIEFMPFGGVAKISGLYSPPPGVEQTVALAGPLHNFILLAGGLWVKHTLNPEGSALLDFFIEGNLSLATFNLIPVLPLDGGRFLRGVLSGPLGYARATRLLARAGQATGMAFLICTLALLGLGYLVPNGFILGFFLLLASSREARWVGWNGMMFLWRKKEEVQREKLLPVRWLLVHEDCGLGMILRHLGPNSYHKLLVVGDGLEELGQVGEKELFEALMAKGPDTPIRNILLR